MSTIAAISTPLGQGGIGIIRISGEKSLDIIKRIFVTKNIEDFKSYTMKHGHIVDNGETLDEVIVTYFKSPKSYTGEDVCEINCHGGNIVLKRVLEVVLRNGAILAEPGEFTKRAFLNGKMDLSQAEAVIDVINSKSERENKISINHLEGYLGRKIKEIKGVLIDILIDIEANIDYPEYDLEEVRRINIDTVLKEAFEKLTKLERTFDEGKILKDGINTVIIGKPNVGKSSLLNALLKEERAIVTEIAGTTRDTIEESLTIKGIPIKMIDTAGIRETDDIVEGIGVEKSKKALEDADLVLMVLDATAEISEEDREIMQKLNGKNYIILINKIDSGKKITKKELQKSGIELENIVEISAKTESGLEELEEKIETKFNLHKIDKNDEIIITNIRHKNAIAEAKSSIEKIIESNAAGIPIDMLSIDLQNAVQYLGNITGETVSEDVINGIFKKFCLGK